MAVDAQRAGLTASELPGVLAVPRRRPPLAHPKLMLQTSTVVRTLLPAGPMIARAQQHANTRWQRDAALREEAHRTMEAIVAGTRREPELAELARRHVIEQATIEALFWRRWPAPKREAASLAHVSAAIATGRPLIVAFIHQGPFFAVASCLHGFDRPLVVVTAPWLLERPRRGYWGRRVARWCRGVAQAGARVIPTGGNAFTTIRALLERGGTVAIAVDMPGRRETHFLGKRAMLARGTAVLAHQTGALVLPVRARRSGREIYADFAAALDPLDFADDETLHRELFAQHEQWILEQPEALESPRRTGAWEDGATADGWRRPTSRNMQ
jgi:hypothetical protein